LLVGEVAGARQFLARKIGIRLGGLSSPLAWALLTATATDCFSTSAFK
jgi:hypothetical protein